MMLKSKKYEDAMFCHRRAAGNYMKQIMLLSVDVFKKITIENSLANLPVGFMRTYC